MSHWNKTAIIIKRLARLRDSEMESLTLVSLPDAEDKVENGFDLNRRSVANGGLELPAAQVLDGQP